MKQIHFDELADLDRNYWWFRTRFAYASRLALNAVPKPDLLVDVGCGTGGFLEYLIRSCGLASDRVLGIEPDERAASIASERGLTIQNISPEHIDPSQLPRLADVVSLLDVLEHIDDAVSALQRLRKLVKTGGYIVILVPAHQALWSSWDDQLGHYRRYSKETLSDHLSKGGWQPIYMRHLFSAMVIPGLIRAKLINSSTISATEFPRVSPWLNSALTQWSALEAKLPALPFGTSIAAIAKKK
jgi:SAM-dependent methyltransferase